MKFNLILGLTIVKALFPHTDIPTICVDRCRRRERRKSSQAVQVDSSHGVLMTMLLTQKCSLRTEKDVKNERSSKKGLKLKYNIKCRHRMCALSVPANELNCELERFKFTSISISLLSFSNASSSRALTHAAEEVTILSRKIISFQLLVAIVILCNQRWLEWISMRSLGCGGSSAKNTNNFL